MHISHKAFIRQAICSLAVMIITINMVWAQDINALIHFTGTHITMGKALSEIERQTNFTIAFNISQVDTGTPVRFERESMTVKETLEAMSANTPYKYVVRSHFILISPDSDNPERANVVARAFDNEPIIKDTIVVRDVTPTSPNLEDRLYEIERIETILPGEVVKRDYPKSYSSYQRVDRYQAEQTALPKWIVSTNLLYGGLFLAPNIGVEMGLKPNTSIEITASYNDWNKDKKSLDDTKQLRHAFARAEFRWWLCERFNGHFFGAHAFWSGYNISGHKIPLLFDKEYRYDGDAYGIGATYGYALPLAKRWNMNFHIGAGLVYLNYDKYSCELCDRAPKKNEKFYFGPTRLGVTISFIIK